MAIIDRRGITVGEAEPAVSLYSHSGLGTKAAVVVASTADLTLSGLQTVDGVTLTNDQRILVKNQSDASENGIYNASSGNWTRSGDFDTAGEVAYGTNVFVVGGSTQLETTWYVSSANPLTIDTSDLDFAQAASTFSGPSTSTDNAISRFDGTTGKKIQNSGVIIDDSDNVTGVVSLSAITIELGHASDTTLSRASAGDVNVEGNIVYRAGGTDVPVSDGGTGAGTFTDGGVLLGSGTGPITATAALSDGEMIVGDGTTDPVLESGSTLRTSIGVGTGDTPQFTGVEVGHATDTTLTRSGAGVLAVEGVDLVNASSSQTLTNKTIDFSNNTMQNVGTGVLARIAGSTYSTIQHLQDIFHSAGHSSGGVISDAGSNTIDVTAGTGFIRATDSTVAEIVFFDWAQSLGLSVPSGTTRYVGAEYNAGSPQVVVSATDNFDYNTDFFLGLAINEGGTIHFANTPHAVGDHAGQMIKRSHQTMGIQRDDEAGGIALGETGTRNITMSAGALWDRLARFAVSALDTSVTGGFDRYYSDGAGGHTKESAQTDWNNTQYDDGSGTLATLSANKYSVQWFYVELDSALLCAYGTVEHNSLSSAEDEAPPTDVPDRILKLSTLMGRLIFKKSDATAQTIESAFATTFGGAVITDHGSLGGLTDDDHTQYVLADGTRAITTPQINDTSSDHQYIFGVSELAADRTVTLPLLTSNDSFTFINHAQVLSNKTLTTPKINDASSDNTYDFAGSELSADRTVTLPLLTSNDSFTFNNHAQTLTNKTFVAPILGTPASGVLTNTTGYLGDGNLVTVGALNSGSITSGFGNIDIGSSTFDTTGTVTTGDVDINGNDLILDADGDTKISAAVDDVMKFETLGTEAMSISAGQVVQIGVGTVGSLGIFQVRHATAAYMGMSEDANSAVVFMGIDSSQTGIMGTLTSNSLTFRTDNTSRLVVGASGGVTIGSPTGGNKGAGTLNATAVYDDNVLLTCYVFDAFLDGKIDDVKWDAKVPDQIVKGKSGITRQKTISKIRKVQKVEVADGKATLTEVDEDFDEHVFNDVPMVDAQNNPVMYEVFPEIKALPGVEEIKDEESGIVLRKAVPTVEYKPAVMEQRIYREPVMEVILAEPDKIVKRVHDDMRKFKARLGGRYDPLDIDKYAQHWKDKGHLTSYPNEVNFDPIKGMSTGSWIQRGVEVDELHSIHISQLNDRIKAQDILISQLNDRLTLLELS